MSVDELAKLVTTRRAALEKAESELKQMLSLNKVRPPISIASRFLLIDIVTNSPCASRSRHGSRDGTSFGGTSRCGVRSTSRTTYLSADTLEKSYLIMSLGCCS